MVEPGIYQHFKGNQYKVLCSGLFEPTSEPVVVYEALYDNKTSKIWVRPEYVFTEEVEVEGAMVPRFKRID